MIDAAVISASDRSSRGEREDLSGQLLAQMLGTIPARVADCRVVPDGIREIRAALRGLTRSGEVKLLLTTGGTGVSPRDVTPEATLPLIERELPAISLALRWASYRGDCLIVNMPGSPKAVKECFAVLLPTFRWLFAGEEPHKGG